MKQKKWDRYEAALLIESADKISRNIVQRKDEIQKISDLLRNRAQQLGEKIDAQFRNKNGISLQLAAVESLMFPNDTDRHCSKLFINMVDLFNNDKDKFNAILIEAHKQI